MADAVGSSFSDAVAHTSLIGAVILRVVTVLLPRKEHVVETVAETPEKEAVASASH
ncbi:hypothetical protein [Streptomyces acidiscabies]|uniref:hypothetical protein n=1 Tax=Streptomyces acidiscabies TaxID=42234 RepID=UPI003BAFBB33